jgi:GT2 family glycosyltransferase
MTMMPQIAVVVPTRGRETRLAFALEALAEQSLDRDAFEVLVVRDEDAPHPHADPPPGLSVRYLTRPGSTGPAAKRNLGWRATEAPLVAFSDDDCRASSGWLEELLRAADDDSAFVQGRTEPDPDEIHLLHGLARSQSVAFASGWFETCNIAYRRSLLERLGGFDETLGFGGEDTDLAYRAIEAGARPRFAAEALVWHAVISRTLRAALRDAIRWNRLPAVIARHPALRAALHRGTFWSKAHLRLPLTLLGLGLAARVRSRALGVAALVPYAGLRVNWRRPHPRRLTRELLLLPLWATVDGTEIAARLPAAARNRVLVV